MRSTMAAGSPPSAPQANFVPNRQPPQRIAWSIRKCSSVLAIFRGATAFRMKPNGLLGVHTLGTKLRETFSPLTIGHIFKIWSPVLVLAKSRRPNLDQHLCKQNNVAELPHLLNYRRWKWGIGDDGSSWSRRGGGRL